MRKLMALASTMAFMLVAATPAFAQTGFQESPHLGGAFADHYLDGGFAQHLANQYEEQIPGDQDFVDGYVEDYYPRGNVFVNNYS